MARFLHASDLHLAKPFGRFSEDLRVRLREARYDKLAHMARIAREHGAGTILLAGDTFDAETPPPQVVRQTLRAMAAEKNITWVVLPGNHDSLAAGDLWERMSREQPENVILALAPEPVLLGDDLAILPAPPTVRHPGRDLTEWMDEAGIDESAGPRIRVGLAHGAIQDFGEGETLGIIAPDRPARAGLDYLALGDWHGRIRVGPRCWYSGTPEADNFKDQLAAGVLLVDIPAPGAEPDVTEIETGTFRWDDMEVDFRPGDDISHRLSDELPAMGDRRQSLILFRALGRLGLSERAALSSSLSDAADDFGFFEADLDGLTIEQEAGDLDDIDKGGALRAAAEALAQGSGDGSRSEQERRVSSAALARLYGYAQEVNA